MQWVIKATKLCNLRCKYCYEWEHLADPTRMSEDVWTHALTAIREYSELAAQNFHYPTPIDIIWHGGEPLTLPRSYFASVMRLEQEIFPAEWIESGRIRNCVQTNLYSVSDGILDFFQENDFALGVSLDFCGGVRLTAGGEETEARVRQNLDRLRNRGMSYSLITVVAQHTASHIDNVFREIVKCNVPVRLLALFAGPDSRPMDGVSMSHQDILAAMFKAFTFWFAAGMSPQIDPFEECVKTITMKKLNLERPRQDRAQLGHEVLVIDRDGSLSCAAYRDSNVLGNVAKSRIKDIVQTREYLGLVSEDAELKKKICGKCSFRGACDTSPISRSFDSYALGDCPTEKYLLPMIETYLEEQDFFGQEFLEAARNMTEHHLQEMIGDTSNFGASMRS